MERYVCIHGHFYQPPRENPWLEAIELQDSAYPYHDWNERINRECYAPNSASRILDGEGRILDIVNNYGKISFNFGPSLLAWLEVNAAETYRAILQADKDSRERFSGHGSAMAQAYNHVILPLAPRRDKYTQVLWGVRDFEHRFGRAPEGMWLPETAVDLESLDILSELGIRFTVLAPHQASRVRRSGQPGWSSVANAAIDPGMPYRLRLPSGRTITLFFYDGSISRAVAFEKLLNRGEDFAQRLLDAFPDQVDGPRLVHIATDGETYGHHHHYGDMALAHALHHIESNGLARITNYGEYLDKHPPTHDVEIAESTSWSCAHGVERWRSNCGCHSGAHPGWNQGWRGPLRQALDWLRDTLAPAYQEMAGALLRDPWAARDDYIEVILERSPERVERFLARHAARRLSEQERTTALKLLELQRHAMLMYTSCGWFFDDLSGIETVQVIRYAGRAVQLGQELFGDDLEGRFLELLERAKSNVSEYGDGRYIYEEFVRPAIVDWRRLGAHYAVSSLFEDYDGETRIGAYSVSGDDRQSFEAGKTRLVVGRARFTYNITLESALLTFGVLHFGDHNINCGVREFQGEEAYRALREEVGEAFQMVDLPGVIRLMDKHFGESTHSLRSLFRDEQRKILGKMVESALADTEAASRHVYERQAPLMRFMRGLGVPLPAAFKNMAHFFLNADLRRTIATEPLNVERVRTLAEEARALGVALDGAGLGYDLTRVLEDMMARLASAPKDAALLSNVVSAVELARSLPFEVELGGVQNPFFGMLKAVYPEYQPGAQQGDEAAGEWLALFTSLGERLSVRVV